MEQENDSQFHQLASKITAFRTIANDINAYSQEDHQTLNGLQGQMSQLSQGIRESANQLLHVMRSNPKVTRMIAISFSVFLVLYYTLRYIF